MMSHNKKPINFAKERALRKCSLNITNEFDFSDKQIAGLKNPFDSDYVDNLCDIKESEELLFNEKLAIAITTKRFHFAS